jgi:hypothetical protein
MKAITVEPKKPGSARSEDVPEPDIQNGSALFVDQIGLAAEYFGDRLRDVNIPGRKAAGL